MLGDARILLCHYDAEHAQRMRFALRRLGGDVKSVVTVGEAIDLLERWHPAAVVSGRVTVTETSFDCELLRAIRARASEGREDVPLVALTPWKGSEAREALLALGFDGHVGSPCLPEQIATEIAQIALRRAAAAGARSSRAVAHSLRK